MALPPIMEKFLNLGTQALTWERDIRPSDKLYATFNLSMVKRIVRVLTHHVDGFSTYATSPLLQPTVRRLTAQIPRSTKQYPLRVSTIEEASVQGNCDFHDNMWERQLKCDLDELGKHAIPCYNNQLTNMRIRGCKAIHAGDRTPYDCRNPLQLFPGLFHVGMNFALRLLSTYRGSEHQTGSCKYFFTLLGKKRLNSEHPDYHTLVAALSQIMEGSILALWE